MKGVFVILDGIGDLPCKILNGKTPLEAAETPNLDFLSRRGELGYLYTVKQGFIPESDEAIVSIFGNDLINSSRGQLEVRGTDIKLIRGDLALRANFATIDSLEKKNILDRRAGRTLTTKEAEILAKDLNKIKLSCNFVFKPTIQHRGVLVFKGGFSDDISGNDLSYTKNRLVGKEKIKDVEPLSDDDNAQYATNIVNEFLAKAFEVLDKHPLNEKRRKKGLMPANYLLLRGAGIEMPKLKQYKKWISVGYMPLEIGFSRVSGMEVYSFNYPKLKGFDVYHNLHKGLKKACKVSIKAVKKFQKKFDYAYIHIKETDVSGHDNKPLEKKFMIEYLDKTLFKFLKKFAAKKKIKILITGDHSTPCSLKSHSHDPVPVLYYSGNERTSGKTRFCEKDAIKGNLGKIIGKELFTKTGFLK
ncbi:MAG: alkaline phosphatase family protein [Nanoarchaeota archaeon]